MTNDRFKFRVWNDMQKCYSPDDHYIDEDGQLNTSGKYIIEQCTGLKDKNGTLIYEGDIIEHFIGTEPKRYIVKWDYFKACFYLKGITYTHTFDVFMKPYDNVIGNIHENPELLKESK